MQQVGQVVRLLPGIAVDLGHTQSLPYLYK
jgi:hypothetical protein